MSDRDLVISYIRQRMVRAFADGDLPTARDMNTFLASVEGMTDGEYAELVAEGSGAIS